MDCTPRPRRARLPCRRRACTRCTAHSSTPPAAWELGARRPPLYSTAEPTRRLTLPHRPSAPTVAQPLHRASASTRQSLLPSLGRRAHSFPPVPFPPRAQRKPPPPCCSPESSPPDDSPPPSTPSQSIEPKLPLGDTKPPQVIARQVRAASKPRTFFPDATPSLADVFLLRRPSSSSHCSVRSSAPP